MGLRFLICRLTALGDVICSLPAAVALKKTFPDSLITWVVDPRYAGIVECCQAVDQVIEFKPSKKISDWRVTSETYDVALDVQGLLKSALIVGKTNAKRKVGYHWQREGSRFFSERIVPDPTSIHVVDRYVDIARAIGAEMNFAEFGLKPKPEDCQQVREHLKSKGIAGEYVVFNAGGGWVTKRWPSEHFAKLYQMISNIGLPCVFIGTRSKGDVGAYEAVRSAGATNAISMLGEYTVSGLVALISMAKAHVGGDTGSSHLAAALSVPAIGLYSITRPERSCPYGMMKYCHYDQVSLGNILPEAVFGTLQEIING